MEAPAVFEKFENISPAGKGAGFAAIGSVFLLVFLLQGDLSFFDWVVGALWACGTCALLAAVFLRKYWIYGIALWTDGFDFRAPFRRRRFIRYASIDRVIASATLDGYGESAITVHISSPDGRAWIRPDLLLESGFSNVLKSLPGFDHVAWQGAHVAEGSLWRSIVPKRTVVFDRRGLEAEDARL